MISKSDLETVYAFLNEREAHLEECSLPGHIKLEHLEEVRKMKRVFFRMSAEWISAKKELARVIKLLEAKANENKKEA